MGRAVVNRDIVAIYKLYEEIIGSEKIKEIKQLSGKNIYQIVKCMNELHPLVNELGEKEVGLKNAYSNSVNEKTPPDIARPIMVQFEKDHKSLFDDHEQEIEIYNLSNEICEPMAKLLSGAATKTLFTYIIIE